MASNVGRSAALRLRKIAAEVEKAQRSAVSHAALEAKTAHLDALRRVVPSARLRNVGKSGARLGVRYDIKGTQNPTALVRATGPWHLIENPIKAHEIRPRRRRGGRRAVLTPDGPRAVVQHPGVRNPKRPWQSGRPVAEERVKRIVGRTYVDAFKRGATR